MAHQLSGPLTYLGPECPEEVEEGVGPLGDTEIWPGVVVEVPQGSSTRLRLSANPESILIIREYSLFCISVGDSAEKT